MVDVTNLSDECEIQNHKCYFRFSEGVKSTHYKKSLNVYIVGCLYLTNYKSQTYTFCVKDRLTM